MEIAPNRLNDFPRLIQFVRRDIRRITRAQFAERTGLTKDVIYNTEKGRTPLTTEIKAIIFDALKITAAEMRLFYVAQMVKNNKN